MGRYFEEFAVGEKITTEPRTVTEQDILSFADLTGDNNRIHTDAEFSKAVEDAHAARPEAVGGAHREAGRITTGEAEFPNMIVGVVGRREAHVRAECERQRIARPK